MNKPILYKMMQELRQQCQFCQLAFKELRANLLGLNQEKVFLFMHACLDHAHQAACLLWPPNAEHAERGKVLREALKWEEKSPLQMAGIRPHMLQPDEEFERWLSSLDNPDYVDMNLMPMAAISDFQPDSFHRSLDAETFKLHWRGVGLDLKLVMAEIRKLELAVQSWLNTNHPW